MKSSDENIKLGGEALEAFFKQFGEIDEQGRIVLEYILELICEAKSSKE